MTEHSRLDNGSPPRTDAWPPRSARVTALIAAMIFSLSLLLYGAYLTSSSDCGQVIGDAAHTTCSLSYPAILGFLFLIPCAYFAVRLSLKQATSGEL